MSKAIKLQKMIEYLKIRKKATREELSNFLVVNKKTVSEYVCDINSEGIYFIESKTGKHGGYSIREKSYKINFDETEINAMLVGKELIKKIRPEIYPEIENLSVKLLEIYQNSREKEIHNHHKTQSGLSLSSEKDRKKENKLNDAIKNRQMIDITYSGVKKKLTERTIEPYKIISYKASSYLLAFCTLRDELRYFKLNRIEKIKYNGNKFNMKHEDKLEEMLNYASIGLHMGDLVKIKLLITSPFDRIISEKKWVEDQIITRIDENSIFYEGTISNDNETITWLFSMKEFVEILEPKVLKDRYLIHLKKMYEKNFN